MSKSFGQRIKDVLTLQTFKDNFFKYDASLEQWFAHGATEAANMVLHGHAAPVYAGNVSPPDLMSTMISQDGPELQQLQPVVPEQEQSMGILARQMRELEQQPDMEEPEMELYQ